MEIAHRWIDRNLTRSELIIAILIFLLMVGIFSRHMILVFSQAERSMVYRTINNINSSLNYRASIMVMRNKPEHLQSLINMNPFEDMQQEVTLDELNKYEQNIYSLLADEDVGVPVNYEGEYDSATIIYEKGKWYFNKNSKTLIYTIKNTEFYDTKLEGEPRILFKIVIDYKDNNKNGVFESNIDEFKSIKLKSQNKYNWIN